MCTICDFNHDGLFKSHYDLSGKDWIKTLSAEDKQLLFDIRNRHNKYGKIGGRARAAQAKRDKKGRFIKNEQPAIPDAVGASTENFC